MGCILGFNCVNLPSVMHFVCSVTGESLLISKEYQENVKIMGFGGIPVLG